ncbi:MAG: helix-turn-helix transcriptional regulator [Lachnospiraceae bacterium]|nr:helix-turn-helix transcriptional regulator [Lachnospiraceae bacterium]
MKAIGEILKSLRLEKGLSQVQAADRIHISKSRLSSYELDVNEPNLETIIKLADLYDVSIDTLVGFDRTDYINVSGLNSEQVTIVKTIVDSYRKL